MKIRLYGIDTPEKGQDFGTVAASFTSSQCFNKIVSVEIKGKDQFRRTLGIVYLPDNRNLNKMLVENGLAWKYKFSKDKELELLEYKARQEKKGLWIQKNPQAPWVFRAQKRPIKK